MRRLLLLALLGISLLASPQGASAQGDTNDKLSLEALTAPGAGDGQSRSYRRSGYHPVSYHGRGGYHHRSRRGARRTARRRRYAETAPPYGRPANSRQSPYLPGIYRPR